MVPLRICFDVEVSDIAEMMMDVFFFLDIVITFNVIIYIKGAMTIKRKLIAISYLKSWFFIDVVATFPY